MSAMGLRTRPPPPSSLTVRESPALTLLLMVLEPNARPGIFSKSGGRFAQRAWFRMEKFTLVRLSQYLHTRDAL